MSFVDAAQPSARGAHSPSLSPFSTRLPTETRFKSLGLRRSDTSWVWAWTTKPTMQLVKLKSALSDLPPIKLPLPSQSVVLPEVSPVILFVVGAYCLIGTEDYFDSFREIIDGLEAGDGAGSLVVGASYILRHALLLSALSRYGVQWTTRWSEVVGDAMAAREGGRQGQR